MGKFVKQHIKDLERIRPYQDRIDYLKLDMNENPEGLPREFFDKVMDSITPATVAMYPEPDKLTHILAEDMNVDFDNVLITNGSDESIKSIFEVFTTEGSKMVSVYPTFEMYMVYAKMFNLEAIIIDYEDDFTLDSSKIVDAIDGNTSLVVLLNPGNPIGTIYTEQEVRAVVEKASENGVIVIIDEAYYYFHDKSFVGLIKEYDNIIVTRTFSKLCSIAGLRIGYAVADKKLIEHLSKIRQTFNVNTLALHFAEAIMKEEGLIDSLIATELEGRNYIIEQLKDSGREVYADNGNYVFFKPLTDKDKVVEGLYEKKILTKTYSVPILKDYIRISTGSKQAMEKFWLALDSVDK